jgi:hypothetical protein
MDNGNLIDEGDGYDEELIRWGSISKIQIGREQVARRAMNSGLFYKRQISSSAVTSTPDSMCIFR